MVIGEGPKLVVAVLTLDIPLASDRVSGIDIQGTGRNTQRVVLSANLLSYVS